MVRKTILGLLIVAFATSAFAVSLPMGHVKIKLSDFTHYYDTDGNPVDFADPYYQQPQNWVGLEVRSIFNVYSIGYVSKGGVFHETWSPVSTNEEVTGVFHDVVVSEVTEVGPFLVIEHTAKAPLPTDCDFGPGLGQANAAGPYESGGARVTLYVDASPDYTNDPDGNQKPDDWQVATHDLDPSGARRLEYPTATTLDVLGNPDPDVSVLFDGVMMDLSFYRAGIDAGVIKYLFANTNTRTATSEFMVNSIRNKLGVAPGPDGSTCTADDIPLGPYGAAQECTLSGGNTANAQPCLAGGSILADWAGQQPQWSDFPDALWGDAHGLTNLEWKPWGQSYVGWFFKSEDPVELYRVPEPATCVLFGGALVALLRRRKRS